MSALLIGAHVDSTDPVGAALARSGTLAQFFLGDPQSWSGPAWADDGGAQAVSARARAAGVGLYVHAPYVINVATTNNRIRIPSRKLLHQHATGAAGIGARGLIVHGGHLPKGEDPQVGVDNWCKALERLETSVPVLLENTAGGDNAMARRLDRLDRLWDTAAGVAQASGVELGFCLDTCHAHAGGEELSGLIDRVTAITGRIDLVHCNDSRDEHGSGADRHANLAKGKIDPDQLLEVVRAAGAPIVCETPGGEAGQRQDIEWLRRALVPAATTQGPADL